MASSPADNRPFAAGVDAHAHVWALEPQQYPWRPLIPGLRAPTTAARPEDLLAAMDTAGLRQAVITQPAIYGADNTYLAHAVLSYPGRLAGVGQIDPQATQAAAQLVYWIRERRLSGLRLNPGLAPSSRWLDQRDQAPLWEAAAALSVPISLRIAAEQLPQLAHMLTRYPTVPVVIDYLNPEAFADPPAYRAFEQLAQLAKHPQLFVKLLPLAAHSRRPYPFEDLLPVYSMLYQAFGGRRIIWGSGWPDTRLVLDHVQALAWAATLPFLSSADHDWFTGRTAAELWRLRVTTATQQATA